VVAELDAGHVVGDRALARSDRHHVVCRHEQKFGARVDELWTSPRKVEGFSDRFFESGEHSWASRGQTRVA
jgi:hypothetical protein